ncbi:MAG: fused MFS/spermidine synthase, partial [Candidatus Limnocylindrales bacterium]
MPPLLGSLVVFGASAAVLALEILAVRLLAPHLGITIEVTTGVIGTVLAGIALGTWVGGRVADRVDPRRLLGPILVLGGGLALAVIPMVGLLAGLDIEADPAGIVLYAGAAFFLPAAVLSATTPTVVKLQLHHLGRTGEVVGGYSAVGTVGAIAGSFLTGFVLVAALPTRPI